MHALGSSWQTRVSNTKQNEKGTSSTLEISKLHVRNVAKSTDAGQSRPSLLRFSEGRREFGSFSPTSHPGPSLSPPPASWWQVRLRRSCFDHNALFQRSLLPCPKVNIVSVVTSGGAQSSAKSPWAIIYCHIQLREACAERGLM